VASSGAMTLAAPERAAQAVTVRDLQVERDLSRLFVEVVKAGRLPFHRQAPGSLPLLGSQRPLELGLARGVHDPDRERAVVCKLELAEVEPVLRL